MSAGATTAYHGNFTLESYDSFGYVMEAVDGDDTFFVIEHMNNADAIGTKTYISTGKIHISGDYPVLSFYDFKVADNCYNLTEVSVICDNEEKVLESYAGYSLPRNGWNRVKTDLSAYKGKDVIIRVGGVLRSHLYNIYDRIEIRDDYKYDLGVAISGPAKVAANEKFDVLAVVENNGALECKGASVDLLRDGAVVDTKEVDAVSAGDAVTLKFAQTIGVVDEYAEYSAVVRYAADENAANNATEPITVVRKKSNLPIVTGLDGKNEASGNALTWNAVDRRDFPLDPISDDLESATSWEHGYAGWTFIDNDGEPVGSFDGLDVPGITAGQTKASFFVFIAVPMALMPRLPLIADPSTLRRSSATTTGSLTTGLSRPSFQAICRPYLSGPKATPANIQNGLKYCILQQMPKYQVLKRLSRFRKSLPTGLNLQLIFLQEHAISQYARVARVLIC